MQCPARLSVTPQGARFLKRGQICLPEALISTGLFLIFCTAVEREFRNCTFQNKSDTIFLSISVDMLGFARPCISSRQQQAGQPGHNLGTKFEFKKGEHTSFWPHYGIWARNSTFFYLKQVKEANVTACPSVSSTGVSFVSSCICFLNLFLVKKKHLYFFSMYANYGL